MSGIKFDFSKKKFLQSTKKIRDNAAEYTYRDICAARIREDGKEGPASKMDMEAIRQSLHNILTFRRGENILDPEFGIGQVYEMLYTPFDKHTTEKMLKTIRQIVATYEPRVEIVSIPTTYDEDKNEYRMTVNYYVPSLMQSATMEVQLNGRKWLKII